MYLADYHVHSHVSPDGKASMLEMAAAAEAEGLDEICFTDHLETVIWRENNRPADLTGPFRSGNTGRRWRTGMAGPGCGWAWR